MEILLNVIQWIRDNFTSIFNYIVGIAGLVSWIWTYDTRKQNKQMAYLLDAAQKNIDMNLSSEQIAAAKATISEMNKDINDTLPTEAKKVVLQAEYEAQAKQLGFQYQNLIRIKEELSNFSNQGIFNDELEKIVKGELDKSRKSASLNTILICIVSLLVLHVLPDIFKYPVVIVTLIFALKEITYYLPQTVEERKKLALYLTSTILFVTLLVYVVFLWLLMFLDVSSGFSVYIGGSSYSARLIFALITIIPNIALLLCKIGLTKDFKVKKRYTSIAFGLFMISLCTLAYYLGLSGSYGNYIDWSSNSIALAIFIAELIMNLIMIWQSRKNWSKLKSLFFD